MLARRCLEATERSESALILELVFDAKTGILGTDGKLSQLLLPSVRVSLRAIAA